MDFYQAVASMVGQEAATAALDPVNVIQGIAENEGIDIRNIKSRGELEQLMHAAGEIATPTSRTKKE